MIDPLFFSQECSDARICLRTGPVCMCGVEKMQRDIERLRFESEGHQGYVEQVKDQLDQAEAELVVLKADLAEADKRCDLWVERAEKAAAEAAALREALELMYQDPGFPNLTAAGKTVHREALTQPSPGVLPVNPAEPPLE